MNIGVIGLGSIGERHVRNLQALYPNAQIDILTKRRSWDGAGKRTHLIRGERRFFGREHSVYFITNETHKHGSTIVKCLAQKPAGIFAEKPLSHTMANVPKIAATVKAQRTVLVVGYNLQYCKPLLELKRLFKERSIGTILAMRVSVGRDLRLWHARDYRKSYSANRSKGGGVVLDLIHDLNYPAWLLGEYIQFVAGGSARHPKLKIEAESIAESIFRTKSGVIVSIHQDYLAVPGGRSCEIVGSKGTITWRWDFPNARSTLRIQTGHKVRTRTISHGDMNRMYSEEVRAFMRHVKARRGYTNLPEAIHDLKNALAVRAHTL